MAGVIGGASWLVWAGLGLLVLGGNLVLLVRRRGGSVGKVEGGKEVLVGGGEEVEGGEGCEGVVGEDGR